MDRFFASLSRNVLALLVIGGGIILMVVMNPPHTVCDSEVELLQQNQKLFLFKDSKDKLKRRTQFETSLEKCQATNTPGGCYELFRKLKQLKRDLDDVPSDCRARVGGVSQVRDSLEKSVDLIARIAWGAQPPSGGIGKFAWLDPADIALYCSLRQVYVDFYGQDSWDRLREKYFKELPGAANLTRETAWENMIFSTNCNNFK